jgi:cell fate regulator YaaT (PSP1 superfamily)
MAALRPHTPDANGEDPGDGHTEGEARSDRTAATVGVRYGAMKWVGEFRVPAKTTIRPGANLVVQSDRGIELGEQIRLTCLDCAQFVDREQIKQYVSNSGPEFYRLRMGKILREASPQDLDEHQRLNEHVREDIARCARQAARFNLDMKVVTAEHLLGGERIVFYFRSEGRVDFRELVRDLAEHYQTRIEMRQVGARDEARLIADYEVCGRECCCRSFLKKLRPVTMRMAKLQKSTLDPSKVSGRCGRLRCCLRYEHEGYDELARRLPRIGARVECEIGPATVIDRQVLTQLVIVRGEDERTMAVPAEQLSSPKESPPKLPTAATQEGQPVEASAGEQSQELRKEQPRSRRRPRRRRKPTDKEAGQDPETTAAQTPAAEAPPTPSGTDQVGDAGAKESAESEGRRPRGRRRRRRRPPRRGRPDTPPGTNEGQSA